MKQQPVSPEEGAYFDAYNGGPQWNWWAPDNRQYLSQIIRCPFGRKGDRLWVRETWAWPGEEHVLYRATDQHLQDLMRTDPNYPQFVWKPSIHMPRWASRIILEITGVRVERLQQMNRNDALAEGIPPWPAMRCDDEGQSFPNDELKEFRRLWDSIDGGNLNHGGGPAAWAQNPWVWVVEFKRIQGGAT